MHACLTLVYNMSYYPQKDGGFRRRRPRKPPSTDRRQMLNMRREKYFRFDLDDLFVEFGLGDNKNTIAATILNKMISHSLDDAVDYVDRLTDVETLNAKKAAEVKVLLQRYSRWR